MLPALSEQIKLADELGYGSISFTEQHFNIEEFEVSQTWCCSISTSLQTKRSDGATYTLEVA